LKIFLISGLILAAGLVFLGWFTKRYADFWFKILVSDKAELVNQVLASEEVPHKWRLCLLERAAKNDAMGFLSSSLTRLLKRWYLLRLERLIHSLGTASFINKDLKAEYLAALREIHDEWQERQDLF
jgi:hypothetical protein